MTAQFRNDLGLGSISLPRHVGIIMDGNGRWAQSRGMPRVAGHRKGVERVKEIVETAVKLGIESLTLFAFSNENWQRPEAEVSTLMGLLRWYLRAERNRLVSNGVRFRMLGDRSSLSKDISSACEDLERGTQHLGAMNLNVAISYGGRGEIARAAARIAQLVACGELDPKSINEETFESYLDTGNLPQVDLVIRTSGEQRISNFLLWQAAYAEYVFDQTQWPDFDAAAFGRALREYSSRQRRFGLTQDQVAVSQRPTFASAGIATAGAPSRA